tara:strand:- start:560 stop:793 length:234 start_codon:yes stop_codon:yes gene_type:complete
LLFAGNLIQRLNRAVGYQELTAHFMITILGRDAIINGALKAIFSSARNNLQTLSDFPAHRPDGTTQRPEQEIHSGTE